MNRSMIALLCVITALAGCGSRVVFSESQSSTDPTLGEAGGLVYHLPQTLIDVTATQDKDTKAVTYVITPSTVGDAAARYRLRYAASSFADNDLNITVDDDGLLTSGAGTTTDQTGNVITVLAKTIAVAAGGVPGPAAAPRLAAPGPKKPAPSPYPFTRKFDLASFIAGPTLPDGNRIKVIPSVAGSGKGSIRECQFSLCYRTTFLLRGTIGEHAAGDTGADFAFTAIDPSITEGVDIRSAGLVKRTDSVTFTKGLATGRSLKQDSTALAAASLPLTVAKAVISAPAELLQLKITNVKDQTDLLTAQTNLITQQKALLDATAALAKAKSPTTTP